MQVSSNGVGWERMGELPGDLMGDISDLTGDSMTGTTGELMGDLAVELGGGEVETLTGVVGAAVGV